MFTNFCVQFEALCEFLNEKVIKNYYFKKLAKLDLKFAISSLISPPRRRSKKIKKLFNGFGVLDQFFFGLFLNTVVSPSKKKSRFTENNNFFEAC